jgi:single-strand DNA-binding protein
MAEGMNRVMLIGNLGAHPEVRLTQAGQTVLTMRLATTESYVDRDKVQRERTDWHNVVVWGRRADALARRLHKGARVFVEGSLRTSSYDDRDGKKRYKTEVVASDVFCDADPGFGARDPLGANDGATPGDEAVRSDRPPRRRSGSLGASDTTASGSADATLDAEERDLFGGGR